jgi:hypothetical protein
VVGSIPSTTRSAPATQIGRGTSSISSCPLLNFLGVYRVAGVKEVLRRRGFLSSARCRAGMPHDRFAAAELEAVIERMQHLWSGPARMPGEMAS